MIKTVATRCYV